MPTITPGSAFARDYKSQIDWSDVIKQGEHAKLMSEATTAAVENGRIKAITNLSEKAKATAGRIVRRVTR